jgi:hypothetical protein
MYIVGWKDRPQIDPLRPWEKFDVFYCPKPKLEFTYEWATKHLSWLQAEKVHVGEHFCELNVECVGDGKYAIACDNHPKPPALPVPERDL